ncbi:MAG: alpha-L-fucosidase, partial [Verrucomicrobia bacterium]|nr:alpha-L-fucosidase [Verrucomicrobiota bacterium]
LPTGDLTIKSLGKTIAGAQIRSVELLGSGEKIEWTQQADGLSVRRPASNPCQHAVTFKVRF